MRDTLTWDTLFFMVDTAIYDYMGLQHPQKPHYGERSIETIELTLEMERKAREIEFKKKFDIVTLDGGCWKIDVPVRKK